MLVALKVYIWIAGAAALCVIESINLMSKGDHTLGCIICPDSTATLMGTTTLLNDWQRAVGHTEAKVTASYPAWFIHLLRAPSLDQRIWHHCFYLYSLKIKLAAQNVCLKVKLSDSPPNPLTINVNRRCKQWYRCFCSGAWAFGNEEDNCTIDFYYFISCGGRSLTSTVMRSALRTSESKRWFRKVRISSGLQCCTLSLKERWVLKWKFWFFKGGFCGSFMNTFLF